MRAAQATFIVLVALIAAAPARANEVTLWACHGPDGAPLGAQPGILASGNRTGDCATRGSVLRADSFQFYTPAGTYLNAVRIDRRAQGTGYLATAGGELERLDTTDTLDGVFSGPASGQLLWLRGGTIDLRSAALVVEDTSDPNLGVGGYSDPARGTLAFDVQAADGDTGLAGALVGVDGTAVDGDGFGTCEELSPGDDTNDVALGGDCPLSGELTLNVDTTAFPDGKHEVEVAAWDAAGNVTEADIPLTFQQPVPPGNSTVLNVGTPTQQPGIRTIAPIKPVVVAPPKAATTRDLVTLPKRRVVSKRGTFTVSALCQGIAPCHISLKLAHGGKTVATGHAKAQPGQRAQITLQLSKSAQRTLERHRFLDVELTDGIAVPLSFRLR